MRSWASSGRTWPAPATGFWSPQRVRAGLELARTQPVDLITLDLLMSPVDGREVFHRLRADVATRNIPVVLVTVADALTDGMAAEGFVSKPFLGRRLLAEVRRLVPLS